MPAFVDLFAGAGGLSLGFIMAGWKPLAFVEKNMWACETYEYNIKPQCSFCKDILKLNPRDIVDAVGVPEAVIGGPPCKPFSDANRKNNGLIHPEYYLPMKFVKYAVYLKPSIIVMEEVPGFKRFLRSAVIEALTEAGYKVTELHLNALHYGIPQNRRRYIIISAQEKCFLEEIVILIKERERNCYVTTVHEAISDLPLKALYDKDEPLDYASPPRSKYQEWARSVLGGAAKIYNHVTSRAEKMLKKFPYIRPGENLQKAWSRLPLEIRRDFKNPDAIHSNIYRRLHPHMPSITITHPRKTVIIHPYVDRIITVREAARLQSFPDSFIFKGPVSVMQQMVADATPPILASIIANSILKVLK